MILEFAVGRYYQTSVISSLMNIRKRFKLPGIIIVIISTAILSYYLVILGWVLSFLILMISGESMSFDEYVNSWYPIFSFLIVLAFTYGIIRRGISNGIERLNKIGIVLLVSMIIPLAIYGIFLPGAQDGIEFYLTPDFSKLSNSDIWDTADVNPAINNKIKNAVPTRYPNSIVSKIDGNTLNTSVVPPAGSIPKAKTNENIINPATNETIAFDTTIIDDVLISDNFPRR